MPSIGEIRERASQLLEDCGYANTFPIPIDKLIEKQGYSLKGVGRDDAPPHFSGLVDHQKQIVVINTSHSIGRMRFTAAHELGHIILHPEKNKVDYRINFNSGDPHEIEANSFAAEILMPYNEFVKIFELHNGNIYLIANYFDVSPAAATIRAEKLGLTA